MVTTARPTVLHTVLVLTHSLAASFLPLDFCNTLNKLFLNLNSWIFYPSGIYSMCYIALASKRSVLLLTHKPQGGHTPQSCEKKFKDLSRAIKEVWPPWNQTVIVILWLMQEINPFKVPCRVYTSITNCHATCLKNVVDPVLDWSSR